MFELNFKIVLSSLGTGSSRFSCEMLEQPLNTFQPSPFQLSQFEENKKERTRQQWTTNITSAINWINILPFAGDRVESSRSPIRRSECGDWASVFEVHNTHLYPNSFNKNAFKRNVNKSSCRYMAPNVPAARTTWDFGKRKHRSAFCSTERTFATFVFSGRSCDDCRLR